MSDFQGKNIRFHLSKPLEQCVEILHKHSLHNRGNALGISVSNLESASHRASAAVSWGNKGMVRTEGKVILIPENKISTIVQIEIQVNAYRELYVRVTLTNAIIFFILMLFINPNLPLWGLIILTLGGILALFGINEATIGFQTRSKLGKINDYIASVIFDLFGVQYNPEITQQVVAEKKKRL